MVETSANTDTRQRILDAAQQLFHRHAYQGVGINAICAEAGVVKGSFYHFFPSKQALLMAVIDRLAEQAVAAMESSGSAQTSGRNRILEFFSHWLDEMESQKTQSGQVLGCCLGVLAAELSASDSDVRDQIRGKLALWHRFFLRQIRSGIEDGSLAPSIDPITTALALLALYQGLSTMGRSSNDLAILRETAQTSIKRLLPVAINP